MHLFPETRILRREFKRFRNERNITLWELNPGTDHTAGFVISCQPLSQSDVKKQGQPWNLPNSRIMAGRTENKHSTDGKQNTSSITAYHCVGIEPRDWPCIWLHGQLLTTQSRWSWKTRSSFELSGNLLSHLSPVLTDWSCGTLCQRMRNSRIFGRFPQDVDSISECNPRHAKVLQQLGWLYHLGGSSFQKQDLAIQYHLKPVSWPDLSW